MVCRKDMFWDLFYRNQMKKFTIYFKGWKDFLAVHRNESNTFSDHMFWVCFDKVPGLSTTRQTKTSPEYIINKRNRNTEHFEASFSLPVLKLMGYQR